MSQLRGLEMSNAVVIDSIRTPIGKFAGSLKDFSAPALGAKVIGELVRKNGITASEIDECIMGNVIAAGIGQNPARQASILAGVPETVPCLTINKVCGSGMMAVMLASDMIRSGRAKLIIAGGMESMTNAPYLLERARFGYRLFDGTLVDSMVRDGLWDKFNDFHMGLTGEICAERHGISREEADRFSLRSHRLACEASESGRFGKEILPVEHEEKGQKITADRDDGPRKDTTLERLSKLKPVFKNDGIVTAGNASSINDGAAAVVVTDMESASSYEGAASANIVDCIECATKPEWLMEAPIPAIEKLLKRNDLSVDEVDIFEHNEAFATASIAVQRAIGIPDEKFNIHGGAIALGHPIGASGARVLTTLLHSLVEKNGSRGIGALCLGGGEAVAMLVEMR